MRRYLIALLILISCSAWADWVEIAETDDGIKTHIDPTTIRKDGNLRKFWTLNNFPKAQKVGS